jgi:N-acetylmuramoyl-L-alanine amidase
MNPETYDGLTDQQLMELCVWREARGEGTLGRRGVAWCIKNRADHPSWWGHDLRTVVLKPYQFSSFNENNPEHSLYPDPEDATWVEIQEMVVRILAGDDTDLTSGATHYFDTSIVFLTLSTGRLRFYRKAEAQPVDTDFLEE